MRKLLLAILLLACCLSAFSKPAKRGFITYTQPDGTTIQIMRHGDEWASWTTNASGQVVRKDADGFFREVAGMTPTRAAQLASVRRRALRESRSSARVRVHTPVAEGQKHFLLILAEFSDLNFSIENPHQTISAMLNQQNYQENGATGSARDYYYENSQGVFEPVFDVYGPVTLEKEMAYYGGDEGEVMDVHATEAIRDACLLADGEVDFSQYDLDADGEVDLVYVIYAGYGQADSGDDDTIWPHQWYLTSADITLELDGVQIDRYACGSELNVLGALDGIGTICHEFGHAIGLPDFYDSDYEENDLAAGLFDYSLMCGGSYNNNGWTPPYLNIEELILLGWLDRDALQDFSHDGVYTLTSVHNNVTGGGNNVWAYKTPTDMEGEYFVYECRDSQGWDQYAPAPGLVVYHVDRSGRNVSVKMESSTQNVVASELWDNWIIYNAINENGRHPCFYVVPAADQTNLMFGYEYYEGYGYYYDKRYDGKLPFPGSARVTTFVPVSWNGVNGDLTLSEIAYAGNQVSFRVRGMESNILDYPVIKNPGNGNYTAGSVFALDLNVPEGYVPELVRWYLDGTQVSGTSLTLTAGTHEIEAEITRQGGDRDVITLEILVE